MFETTEPDAVLVQHLLSEQHPDLADRAIEHLASGWDNHMFRLGRELVVRVPSREAGARLLAHEIRWLPELAPRLPLPIPDPVRVGQPSSALGYPWPWSVVRWIEGTDGLSQALTDESREGKRLATFFTALHTPAPAEAPKNAYRGMPLVERTDRTLEALDRLDPQVFDVASLTARWGDACAAPTHDGPPVWLHGDLHPANVVLHDGALAAIIDFGDITFGDPACDLSIAHTLFGDAGRTALREHLDVDESCWRRAEGWAIALCLAYNINPDGHPALAARGLEVLRRLGAS